MQAWSGTCSQRQNGFRKSIFVVLHQQCETVPGRKSRILRFQSKHLSLGLKHLYHQSFCCWSYYQSASGIQRVVGAHQYIIVSIVSFDAHTALLKPVHGKNNWTLFMALYCRSLLRAQLWTLIKWTIFSENVFNLNTLYVGWPGS